MVASEVHPFAKTGGLADVLGALPRALVKLGHQVDVVMPRYRGITAGSSIGQVTVSLGGQVDVVDVSAVIDHGVRYVFIAHAGYFEREYLYGAASRDYPDNPERFAFLSQAALSVGRIDRASVRHRPCARLAGRAGSAHGSSGRSRPGAGPPVQQRSSPFTTSRIRESSMRAGCHGSGFGWDLMRVDALEYWNRISFLKGGIVFAASSRPSVPDMPRKSRRQSWVLDSTESCARARLIWSAFSTESITINGIPSGT